jgi:hypothetical protein
LLLGAALPAFSDGTSACGPPSFESASAWLETYGYGGGDYQLLIAWSEETPSGEQVNGYRLKPVSGGAAFDVYADSEGNLLPEDALPALGIRPKSWDLPPMEQAAELPKALAQVMPERPAPKSAGLKAAPAERAVLPPLDLAAIAREDARAHDGSAKGAWRIGVHQELPEPITLSPEGAASRWIRASDGTHVWTGLIEAPEAIGQRVEFTGLALPDGARLIIYNADAPQEAYRVETAPEPDVWSPTCFGSRVVIECTAPDAATRDAIAFTVERIIHVYRPLSEMAWTEQKQSGSCNIDVACYEDAWGDAASAVGALAFINDQGFIRCSGSLLADSDPSTREPYLLTANHCPFSGPSSAASLEVFWLYQRASCGGFSPSIWNVPRTSSGADYLVGVDDSVGNDFALLRLRGGVPASVGFLGWASYEPSANTPVTSIHHPRGDVKKISFGRLLNVQDTYYHHVQWNLGTTEPGSSGGPLMRTDTQQVIGQLWGGSASCDRPTAPDQYGKFSHTLPLVLDYLSPRYDGPEDLDDSGSVNAIDVQIAINAALGLVDLPKADLDGSGGVNAIDVQRVINAALGLIVR